MADTDFTLRLRDFTYDESYQWSPKSGWFQDDLALLMTNKPTRVLWADLPEAPTRTWPVTGQAFPQTGLTIGCDRRLHIAAVRYYGPDGTWASYGGSPLHPEACLSSGIGNSALFPWYSHLRLDPIPELCAEFARSGGARPQTIDWRRWSPPGGAVPAQRPVPLQFPELSVSFLNLVGAPR